MILTRPYPDELVGSFLHRTARQLGLGQEKLLFRLTGRNLSTHSLLMTVYPGIADAAGMPFEELLLEHTVLPYVTAFMKPTERAVLVSELLSVGSTPRPTSSLVASSVVGEYGLRVCPRCMRWELENFGETYWHRTHQVSGVRICAVHMCTLLETELPITRSLAFPPPNEVRYLYRCPTFGLAPEIHESIAALTAFALSSRGGLGEQASRYMSRTRELGYVYLGGKAHSTLLSQDLLTFYGAYFLERYDCVISEKKKGRWPSRLLSASAGQSTTFKHILLQSFLESNPSPSASRIEFEGRNQPKRRDWSAFQAEAIRALSAEVRRHEIAGTRVNLEALYDLAGIRSAVKTKKERIPALMQWIENFKASPQSNRIPRRRPRR